MKGIVLSLNRYLAQWQRDKIKNSHIDNGVRATTCNLILSFANPFRDSLRVYVLFDLII